ncbi:hypothetical protein OIU76_024651 [Salix suchowensis]|nr:hypothetical protein OIU76_024651 [Salix suchowensis]
METGQPSGTLSVDDLSSLSSTPATTISRWSFAVSRRFQHFLDKTVPYILYRWIACLIIVLIYVIRVYFVQGFYIITYGLGIYLLNLLIGFLSPQIDLDINDGPTLPTRGSDEFRPFARRLTEFKFWYSITKAFLQISHMIKYRYLPFSTGKQRYDGKKAPSAESADLPRD